MGFKILPTEYMKASLTFWGWLAGFLLLVGSSGCVYNPPIAEKGIVPYDSDWQMLENELNAFQKDDLKKDDLKKVAEKEAILYGSDWQMLESGHDAFQKGDFKKAAEIFELVNHEAQDREIGRKSLYGLACVRLILAENIYEFTESLRLWEAWGQLLPKNLNDEDPRMLKPLLTHEKQVCQKKLDVKKKDIQWLRYRLGKMKKENNRLKQQIEALEAIHRKIQEKKNEISLP